MFGSAFGNFFQGLPANMRQPSQGRGVAFDSGVGNGSGGSVAAGGTGLQQNPYDRYRQAMGQGMGYGGETFGGGMAARKPQGMGYGGCPTCGR